MRPLSVLRRQARARQGNPVQIGGVFNTTQPTVTNGQAVEVQATARGAQIVAPGVDNFAVQATLAAETTKVIGTVNQGTSPWVSSLSQSGTANDVDVLTVPALVAGTAIIGKVGIDQTTPGTTNGVQVNAALPAGSNVIGHVIHDSGSTTAVTGNVTVVQPTAANLNATVVGAAASGASKAGNPVQIGGVFNTTQPTVTNGQAVEVQATARGAQIVAPGVDNFAVQATLAAETTKVIGTVNQGTSPWVSNVSQFGGSAVSLGRTTSAASLPVVLANDALPPPDRAVTGTIASNGAVLSITAGGTGTTTVAITGTWVGGLLVFGIDGGGAGNALYAVNGVTGQPETSITANGIWQIPSAGWSSVGLTSTSWTSGTASIAFIAGMQSNVMALARSLPTGTNSIGQVTANAGSNLNTSLLALETTQVLQATAARQDTLQTAINLLTALIAGPSGIPSKSALNVQAVNLGPGLPKPICNPVLRINCQPKGF
jgi:hypothetical protein